MESSTPQKLSESLFFYEKGIAHWQEGNYELAMGCLDECVRIGHRYYKAAALVCLGALLNSTGNREKLLVYLHKIAELPEEESKFVPQAVLGRTYTALGEYDRAADAYRRACMVKSPDPSLILNLAELEIIRKRYSSAEDLLARVCSRDATVLLMTTVLRLFLAAARGRFEEIHSVLRTIMRVLVAQGVPPDFRWDFSDVLPVLREVAHPDIFHLLRQMVGVLRRDVDVQEFLGSFPQVAEDWQPLLVRV